MNYKKVLLKAMIVIGCGYFLPAYSITNSFLIRTMLEQSILSHDKELDELGTEKVSPENEQFIQNIYAEIGLANQPLEIRKMNERAIDLVGYENAFVLPYYNIMFISEDWFNELTEQEKRFLIGHECSHLLKQHGASQVAAQLALDFFVGRFGGKRFGTDVAKILVLRALSRKHEREADTVAATRLQCAAGGVALFERMSNKDFEEVPKRGISRFFNKLDHVMQHWFHSHPGNKKRINYLRSMAREQERSRH